MRICILALIVALATSAGASPPVPGNAQLDPTAGGAGPAPVEPTLSESAVAQRLRKRVDATLRRAPIRNVRVGLVVADVESGEEWVRRDPDGRYNPASTLKLFTAAAALAHLGPDHVFHTSIRREGDVLYLLGTGDPMLTTEHLERMVDKVARAFRDRPPSRIVVDATMFGGGVLPPGYDKKKTDAAYRAATGAVALDSGATRVTVRPGRKGERPAVTMRPPGSYVIVQNEARTVKGKKSTLYVHLEGRDDRSVARITGRVGVRNKGATVRRRIEHPPLAAGYALRSMLYRKKVRVTSETPVVLGEVPEDTHLLATHQSPPMSRVISDMNKHSNNFIAEMLVRAIPQRVGATWEHGQKLISDWLAHDVGLGEGRFVYRNGSGLYEGGQFSPRQVVRLLRFADRSEHAKVYRDSLAIAGRDGTLSSRLTGAKYKRRMRGKTGTLNKVSALSGFVTTRSKRRLAFSMLMNDTGGATSRMRALQDSLVRLLIDSE